MSINGETGFRSPAPVLDQSRLFIVFSFRGRLRDLREAHRLPLDDWTGFAIRSTDSEQLRRSPTWEPDPTKLSVDFHDSLSKIYDRSLQSEGRWRLAQGVVDSLNKRAQHGLDKPSSSSDVSVAQRGGYGLALKLSRAACSRLGDTAPASCMVPVRIEAGWLRIYQTRLAQVVIEVSVGTETTSAALAVETLHALAHDRGGLNNATSDWTGALGRLRSSGEMVSENGSLEPTGRFNLFDLAARLVKTGTSATVGLDQGRAFTYALARTSDTLTAAQRAHWVGRLARRLTWDYDPTSGNDPDRAAQQLVTTFDNVTHGCAVEGGATLVSDEGSVDFLADFVSHTGERVYLQLALLARKTYHDLIELSEDSAHHIEFADLGDIKSLEGLAKTLTRMQERLLNFRLAHRFSVVSVVENHNLVHAAWCHSMRLDWILADVSQDVAEAVAYIQTLSDRKREKRLVRNTAWLQAVFAFFAVWQGSVALVEALSPWIKGSLVHAGHEASGNLPVWFDPVVPLSLGGLAWAATLWLSALRQRNQ